VSPTTASILPFLGGFGSCLVLTGTALLAQRRLVVRARAQTQHLADLANHDDITALPNRRLLLTRVNDLLAAAEPIGIVMIDLDGFKTVNDTYGHATGNRLLAAVGARLHAVDEPTILVARLSGDEFAALAVGAPWLVAAAAEHAQHALCPPVYVGEHSFDVHASIGYATSADAATAEELLHAADLAMYAAKRAHLGQPVAYASATVPDPPDRPAHTRPRDLHRR
jgi:diguanylate cyclase (GGDEF)-like protein